MAAGCALSLPPAFSTSFPPPLHLLHHQLNPTTPLQQKRMDLILLAQVTEAVPLPLNQWSRSRDQPRPTPAGALQVGGDTSAPSTPPPLSARASPFLIVPTVFFCNHFSRGWKDTRPGHICGLDATCRLFQSPLCMRNVLTMASSTTLKSITLGQQNCKVYGRLIRLWDAINMKSKFADPLISIDGILLDEDGTMAQISVPKKFVKQFRPLLAQGSVYIITDVAAVDIQNRTYIYHHQNYMLQFKYNTKVQKLESRGANIPKFSFNLCPFDKLPEKNISSKPLIDIIGVINYVGPFDYASPTSQNKRRIIKVRNLDEETHEIRLWGHHGESFDEKEVLEKSKEGIVVGIFAGLTEGEYFGTAYASSSSATQIYLDLDIPEVQNYRTSYQWETPTLKQQLPQVIHLSPIQAAGKLFNLAEISTMPDSSFQGGATYSTIAKITSVLPSAKWYYKVCNRCDQGYNSNSDTSTCGCPMSYPKPMYKLPLTLTDNYGSLNAIAFSSIAENLVERDAVQASQNMKIDAGDHVVALDNAIGKTKLFYIGMKTGSPSKFPISHIIRKCFPIDEADTFSIQPAVESSQSKDLLSLPVSSNTSSESPTILSQGASQDNTSPVNVAASHDTENIQTRNSGTKRKIDFNEDVTGKFQSSTNNKNTENISGHAE